MQAIISIELYISTFSLVICHFPSIDHQPLAFDFVIGRRNSTSLRLGIFQTDVTPETLVL